MNHSFLQSTALVSGLILTACGARSSLTDLDPNRAEACGWWNVYEGAEGTLHSASLDFAALDDGSVVVPMAEEIVSADEDTFPTLTRQWVQKLDPDGEVAWEVMGKPYELGFGVAARDPAGGVYLAGTVMPGGASVLGTVVPCAGEWPCAFLAKLTSAGEPTWVKALPPNAAVIEHLAVMEDGRITVEGSFDGTLDLGCGPATGTADGKYRNLFLARLSPTGECLWSRALVSDQFFAPFVNMAVGETGDVALALTLTDAPPGSSIDFGGGPLQSGNSIPYRRMLAIAKYAPDGAFVFAKVAGDGDGGVEVGVTDAGEVILAGVYTGPIDFGGGPRGSEENGRQFVTRLSAIGEELWTRDIATEYGRGGLALALDSGGGFFLAGRGHAGMAILGAPVPEMTLFTAAFDAGGQPIDLQTFPLSGEFLDLKLSARVPDALVLVGTFNRVRDMKVGVTYWGPEKALVATICR